MKTSLLDHCEHNAEMPPWGRHYPREHCARNATVRAMGLAPQPARYTRASCDEYEDDDGYDDAYDDVDEDATYQRKISNSRGRGMRQPVESTVSRLRSCLRCSARVFVVVLVSAILLATAPSSLMPSPTSSSPTNTELQLSPPPAPAQLWIQTQATCTPPPGTRVDGNEIRSGDCENLKAVVGQAQRAGRCRYIQRSAARARNLCAPR